MRRLVRHLASAGIVVTSLLLCTTLDASRLGQCPSVESSRRVPVPLRFVGPKFIAHGTRIVVALPRSLVMMDCEGKLLWSAAPAGRVWMGAPRVQNDGRIVVAYQREIEDAERQREFRDGPTQVVYAEYDDDGRLVCEKAGAAGFPSVLRSRGVSVEALLHETDGGWLVADGNVLRLLDEQGVERWKRSLPFPVTNAAVVDDGFAYVLTTRELNGLSLREDGRFLWQRDCGDRSVLAAAPNGTAYLVDKGLLTPARSATLVALDIDGRELWQRPVRDGHPSTLLVGAARSVFALPNGILYSPDGQVLWEGGTLFPESDVRLTVASTPGVAYDKVGFWLRLKETNLVLLGEDGEERFRREVAGRPLLPPAMAGDGSVCVADAQGGLSLLSPDGRCVWRVTADEVQRIAQEQGTPAGQE